MKKIVLKALFMLLIGIMPLGYADVPGTVSYQGYLSDASNNPVDGPIDITFSILGTAWTETHNSVPVNQGVFGVLLGNQTSLVGVDFNQASQLRIEVNGISKTVKLSSVPAAILAQKVVEDSDTLKALDCASGQMAKSTGSHWKCADGAMGQQGPAGPPGEKGEKGKEGDKGPKGDTGSKGESGQKGEKGDAGSKGEPGTKGDSGLACWDLNGNGQPETNEDINRDKRFDVDDCKGPKGDKGDPGSKGATGATGAKGATGPQGPAGPPGRKGEKGETGAKGEPGSKGATGAAGPNGATGATGSKGESGLACWDLNGNGQPDTNEDINRDKRFDVDDCKGPKGDKGDPGAAGAPGQRGATGQQGSAGPPGQKGEKGETGAKGEPGEKGATGATGPNGATGAAGAPGASPFGLTGNNAHYTAGNVGIGTTNPQYKLDVAGPIRSTNGGFIFPDGKVQSTAASGNGDITGVTAGSGLTGGGSSGNVSLAINNNGITNAMLQNNSVNGSKILDNSISNADVNFYYARGTSKNGSANHALNASNASNLSCTNCVSAAEVQFNYAGSSSESGSANYALNASNASNASNLSCNSCVSASEIGSGQVVKSINNLEDSVSIREGTGINVNTSGSTITISAEGSSGGNYVNLSSSQTIGGNKTFSDTTIFKDDIYFAEKVVFGRGSGSGRQDITFEHSYDDLEIDMGYSRDGELTINGSLYVREGVNSTVKSFKIDHPLYPDNKYLIHASVESPDMMNVYSDNIVTDGNGEAIIHLPEYFEALNKDFRYQLTCIGTFAQAIVAEEVQNNQFKIKTDVPNVKVSWQITGIRQDAWANAHRIIPEVDKPLEEQGTRLFTEE